MKALDRFAEALADCGSVAEAAHEVGATREYGRCMFKRIKRKLGWQAQ